MIIAKQKRSENIAEYILYMWQVEDTLRALKFDIQLVKAHLIDKFDQTEEVKREMQLWYENLIEMMRLEKIEEKGHIKAVYNLISDLDDVHKYLLKTPSEAKYQHLFQQTETDIADLRKMQMASSSSDIEVSFNFLYGILLLKVKQRPISSDTTNTLNKLSALIGLLSLKYKQIEDGMIELDL